MNREDLYYAIEEEASYQKLIDVLRAVVELHKPDWSNNNQGLSCAAHYMLTDYPCETIQAIEKELK